MRSGADLDKHAGSWKCVFQISPFGAYANKMTMLKGSLKTWFLTLNRKSKCIIGLNSREKACILATSSM